MQTNQAQPPTWANANTETLDGTWKREVSILLLDVAILAASATVNDRLNTFVILGCKIVMSTWKPILTTQNQQLYQNQHHKFM